MHKLLAILHNERRVRGSSLLLIGVLCLLQTFTNPVTLTLINIRAFTDTNLFVGIHLVFRMAKLTNLHIQCYGTSFKLTIAIFRTALLSFPILKKTWFAFITKYVLFFCSAYFAIFKSKLSKFVKGWLYFLTSVFFRQFLVVYRDIFFIALVLTKLARIKRDGLHFRIVTWFIFLYRFTLIVFPSVTNLAWIADKFTRIHLNEPLTIVHQFMKATAVLIQGSAEEHASNKAVLLAARCCES